MGWRVVVCRSVEAIKVRNGQLALKVQEGQDELYIPVEDIDTIILENKPTNLTLHALQILAQANINLVISDESNLPCATLTSFARHSRQLGMLKLQMSSKLPLTKSLWTKICKQKIDNQKALLLLHGHNKSAQQILGPLTRIKSGDPGNQEAVAARIYFRALWPVSRRSEHLLNSLVNYGYALFRSSLARHCAAHGLSPAVGIHHAASLNPFNLADDLLEPFRSIVDETALAYYTSRNASGSLDASGKNEMLALLNKDILLTGGSRKGERASASIVFKLVVQSLVEALQKRDIKPLVLPVFESIVE